jgi:hypothetical protein
LGEFRAITVGLQVKDKVAQATPEVMKLLLEPPVRASGASGAAGASGSSAAARAAIAAVPSWALIGAAGLLVLGAVGLALVLLLSRRSKKGDTAA